jgi:hypothetical protein
VLVALVEDRRILGRAATPATHLWLVVMVVVGSTAVKWALRICHFLAVVRAMHLNILHPRFVLICVVLV